MVDIYMENNIWKTNTYIWENHISSNNSHATKIMLVCCSSPPLCLDTLRLPPPHHVVLPLFGGVQTNLPTRSNLIKTNKPRSFFHLPPLPGHVVLVLSSCSFLKNNHTAHEIFLFVFVCPREHF